MEKMSKEMLVDSGANLSSFPIQRMPQNGQLWEEGMDVQFGEDEEGNTNCGRWIGRNFGHHFCPSNELFTYSTPPSLLSTRRWINTR
jgi:hypothetical protein